MTLPEKIYKEKLVLELFRKNYKEFPKGRLQKTESPDFILKVSAKKSIGIELTELYNHNQKEFNFSVEQIEILIAKKEEKIRLYKKKKVNELWLIVTVDAIKQSDLHKLISGIEKHEFNSFFNKVFLFEIFDRKIFELVV